MAGNSGKGADFVAKQRLIMSSWGKLRFLQCLRSDEQSRSTEAIKMVRNVVETWHKVVGHVCEDWYSTGDGRRADKEKREGCVEGALGEPEMMLMARERCH